MTISIGRCGRDAGLTLNSPEHWDLKGDSVSFEGDLTATDIVDLYILRQQLNGYQDNPDEPFVSLVWPGDPTRTGYYDNLEVEVPMPNRGLAARRLRYQATMRRVSATPVIESAMSGGLRVNAHGIVLADTNPWLAFPNAALMDYIDTTVTATRTGETHTPGVLGTVKLHYTTNGTALVDAVPTWQCPANNFYNMEARIEVFNGTTWRTLVGRQMFATITANAAVWRLTNGLTRITWSAAGKLLVEHHDGTNWVTGRVWRLTAANGTFTALAAFNSITVNRNGPAEVSVRLMVTQSSSTPLPVTVDLTLRRGSRFVAVRMTRPIDYQNAVPLGVGLGVVNDTPSAGTIHTSGVHQTTASGGLIWIISTAQAKTNDLTNGGFYGSSSPSDIDLMIGASLSGASAPDDFTSIVYEWADTGAETMAVVRP